MVFQNYSVWPHMKVFNNVAYGLKLQKIPAGKVRKRTLESLEMVGLEGLEDRYPSQLSGGQQQRVALARALVRNPKVLLLDEPLSNLDAKLREKMRFEIKNLVKRMGMTAVYVTHDQAEAMVISDRIAVMDSGNIVQIGTAEEIYSKPRQDGCGTGRHHVPAGATPRHREICCDSGELPQRRYHGARRYPGFTSRSWVRLVAGSQLHVPPGPLGHHCS